ncbi:MAG: MATE family efflux transporter, partial [Candidatus Eisenbacteria bacterium]
MTLSERAAVNMALPVPHALLRLALPIFASQALRLAYQWVDALWVRGLGVESTAAITTSVFVLWWVYALNDVFCVGASAFVSQLIGAGERGRAGATTAMLVRASAVLGLMVAVAAPFVARPIFQLLDPTGQVVDEGTAYLRVVLLAAPLTMVAIAFETAMRAAGDTRTPLLLDLGAVLLNALLAPVLIYGWGPFPRMGIAGAALATAIAHGMLVVNFARLARRGHPALPFSWRATEAPIRLAALARVGLPNALIGILFSVVYIVFARAASPYGA